MYLHILFRPRYSGVRQMVRADNRSTSAYMVCYPTRAHTHTHSSSAFLSWCHTFFLMRWQRRRYRNFDVKYAICDVKSHRLTNRNYDTRPDSYFMGECRSRWTSIVQKMSMNEAKGPSSDRARSKDLRGKVLIMRCYSFFDLPLNARVQNLKT